MARRLLAGRRRACSSCDLHGCKERTRRLSALFGNHETSPTDWVARDGARAALDDDQVLKHEVSQIVAHCHCEEPAPGSTPYRAGTHQARRLGLEWAASRQVRSRCIEPFSEEAALIAHRATLSGDRTLARASMSIFNSRAALSEFAIRHPRSACSRARRYFVVSCSESTVRVAKTTR
jgi:hypothetical protein